LVVLPVKAVTAREYYYFNKPSVTREAYVADKTECDQLAGGVTRSKYQGPSTVYVPQSSTLTAGQNAAAVAIASLFAGLMFGGIDKRAAASVERTCMADKGYGRYRVDKAMVKDIEKLKDDDARIARLFALASAEQPVGERVKE
jgi:hypothetical protein